MQADILQVPVRRPAHLETTSLGAALAAGIGAGFWSQHEALVGLKQSTGGTLFEPQITRAAAGRRHAKWKLAVQRSFGLAELTRDLEVDSEPREPEVSSPRRLSSAGGLAAAPQGPEA